MERSHHSKWPARFGLAAAALIAVCAAAPPVIARDGDRDSAWLTIGRETADFDRDVDLIRVPREASRLSRIRLNAAESGVHLSSVRIIYADGTDEQHEPDERIAASEASTPIVLRNPGRPVKEIELRYRTRRSGARPATVTLLGDPFHDPAEHQRPRAGERRERAFDVVANASVDRFGERTVIEVRGRDNRASHVKLRVTNGRLALRGVELVFGNGDRQRFEVERRMAAGEETEALAINGDPRYIREVIVLGRSSRLSSGAAEVEVALLDTMEQAPAHHGRPHHAERNSGEGWVLFGTQSVGFGVDRDIVRVGAEVGQFDRIALKALKNDIYLREVAITYADGSTRRLTVNQELKAGQRTPPLSLDGDRFIREIELLYQAKPDRRGEAIVEVYGDYADGWLREGGKHQGHNAGWVMLGAQRATMFGSDRDVFQVGERFGRFRAVRVVARRNAVKLQGMTITYGNGSTEAVAVAGDLAAGQSTQPIDLKGRERFIGQIGLKYKSKLSLKGDGIVEVWGLR